MSTFNNHPIIMLAEDSDDTRTMLAEYLVMHGCRVVEADNGKEAVKLFQHRCPDLILMDLHLPLMDGLAAIAQIRAYRDSCNDVPIVAITAHDGAGVKESAFEAGCDEYLTKPIDFTRLEAILHQILDKH